MGSPLSGGRVFARTLSLGDENLDTIQHPCEAALG
jgi:hypothetical protein